MDSKGKKKLKYETEDITTYLTPCPFLDPLIKVGSPDCQECVDCLGHNPKSQEISCRHLLETSKVLSKRERLEAGETFETWEPGNSMTPILKSNQHVLMEPAEWDEVEVGDIVYCKVAGNYYTHLVKATSGKRGVLIGNNHGHLNGWTKRVYGKVIKIL